MNLLFRIKQILFFIYFATISTVGQTVIGKEEEKDFQDYFFESLLQKGIENYDNAISCLEKGLKLNPTDATSYFEIGKNYLYLKNYSKAYSYFEKATKIDPSNKWFWEGMYDVCYQTGDYKKGITIVEKLILFDEQFKNDLISLYMNTREFDKALTLINEMNSKYDKSDKREFYKTQILSGKKYQYAEIENLKTEIDKNPKDEANYVSLIFLYIKNDEFEKADEIAKKLESTIPDSEWAQVSLFKKYLVADDAPKAIKSMDIILQSKQIDYKIKHRVFNEFLIYTEKNPQYFLDLEKAIAFLNKEGDIPVYREVGKYFYKKQQWQKAIKYFEITLEKSKNPDIETETLLLQSQVEMLQFEVVAKKSERLIDLYPALPQFYYYCGLSNNQLKKYRKSIEFLEMGLDYVLDDMNLEINFNIQLGEAYNGLENVLKKEYYFTKADELLKKMKK